MPRIYALSPLLFLLLPFTSSDKCVLSDVLFVNASCIGSTEAMTPLSAWQVIQYCKLTQLAELYSLSLLH